MLNTEYAVNSVAPYILYFETLLHAALALPETFWGFYSIKLYGVLRTDLQTFPKVIGTCCPVINGLKL